MLKIGIFGGSFDPVHLDHVEMCKRFAEFLRLDKVIVVPARLSPFKNSSSASAEDRFKMLTLAFEGMSNVYVSRFEIEREDVSYSYKTVRHFKEEFKKESDDVKLYFLIGADSLLSFTKWKYPSVIAKNAKICVAGRDDSEIENAIPVFKKKYGYKPIILPFTGCCSSTETREYLYLGLNTEKFLPRKVIDYISENNLYQPDYCHNFLREHSKEKRLVHTVGVIITAMLYAKRTGADVKKAELAALLHDVAKYLDKNDYPDCEIDKDVPDSVVHQFLGAYVAEKILGVTDEEVLGAIRWHTTGRPNMTLLEKIVYTADLLEPGRTFQDVNALRKAVDEDFESGFRRCVKEMLLFLIRDGGTIYHLSEDTDKYYNG